MNRTPHLCLLVALASAPAAADVFTETFDGGGNVGGWTFGTGTEVIEPAGGNPGAWLHVPFLDTFAPQPRTSGPSLFTGDFRAENVTRLAIDLLTVSVDFSAEGRPLTLMLISDQGTPGNQDDDWAAYLMGPDNVPLPGQGWISYSFDVPSQERTLPAGWATLPLGSTSPPDPDWNLVIQDVVQVRFFYGDPTFFFIFQGWDLGLDNPTVERGIFIDGFESGDASRWSGPAP
jgi:hypothetical protein